MENFLKKSKTGDSFSTNDSSFIYSFIGTLKSLFYASTCQPKSQVGKHYPVCHSVQRYVISFITLQRWKWIHESANTIEEKGPSYKLGALDVTNELLSLNWTFSGLEAVKGKI